MRREGCMWVVDWRVKFHSSSDILGRSGGAQHLNSPLAKPFPKQGISYPGGAKRDPKASKNLASVRRSWKPLPRVCRFKLSGVSRPSLASMIKNASELVKRLSGSPPQPPPLPCAFRHYASITIHSFERD
jgi:hypothetical protein